MADNDRPQGGNPLVWILVLVAFGAIGYLGWRAMSKQAPATAPASTEQAAPAEPAPVEPAPAPTDQPRGRLNG